MVLFLVRNLRFPCLISQLVLTGRELSMVSMSGLSGSQTEFKFPALRVLGGVGLCAAWVYGFVFSGMKRFTWGLVSLERRQMSWLWMCPLGCRVARDGKE